MNERGKHWDLFAQQTTKSNVSFVFPPQPVPAGSDAMRYVSWAPAEIFLEGAKLPTYKKVNTFFVIKN